MVIKILFDRESINSQISYGWGLSFLVDTHLLFDSGENYIYLQRNAEQMGVDLTKINKVVISHDHWDHTGGLKGLPATDLSVYICENSSLELKDSIRSRKQRVIEITAPKLINENIYSTGQFIADYNGKKIGEQSLVLKTGKGLVLLCGCSHPGIINIVSRVKEQFPDEKICLVAGGTHLLNEEERAVRFIIEKLKELGVEKIAPSHCTGPEAEFLMKQTYKDNFIEIKAGKTLEI